MDKDLTFKELSSKVVNFGKDSHTYWGCSLMGEIGEAIEEYFLLRLTAAGGKVANTLKKMERDNLNPNKLKLSHELADTLALVILTSKHLEIDLEKALLQKVEIIKAKQRLSLTYCKRCKNPISPETLTVDYATNSEGFEAGEVRAVYDCHTCKKSWVVGVNFS